MLHIFAAWAYKLNYIIYMYMYVWRRTGHALQTSVVYPPTGSRPRKGRWAPHLRSKLEHGPLYPFVYLHVRATETGLLCMCESESESESKSIAVCCCLDYKNDPYSEGDPCSTICCRGDLMSPPKLRGCYDAKVCWLIHVCVLQALRNIPYCQGVQWDGQPIDTTRALEYCTSSFGGLEPSLDIE